MKSIVKVLRWILFIPAGFVASTICGVVYSLFTTHILDLSGWLSDFIVGGFTALIFIFAATQVSPQEFSSTKMSATDWIILTIVSFYGVFGGIASIYQDGGFRHSITGFTIAAVTIYFYAVAKKQMPDDTFTIKPSTPLK